MSSTSTTASKTATTAFRAVPGNPGKPSRRSFLAAGAGAVLAPQRPNILWISIEDSSPQLGCYGDPLARTPNIDRLAREGMRFTNAYATIGVCAPCRSSIITGMFPASYGAQHMRSNAPPPESILCFPEYLRRAGYFCTNNSKTDYNFPAPQSAWDQNGPKAHWKNRPSGQPFFSVFNLTITHESQIVLRGDRHLQNTPRLTAADRCNPARVTVPPYYPDRPEVRRDLANVYDILAQMDYQAGDLLKELSQAGLDSDTYVFFWSDHGVGLPRAKRWLYQSSTHVPLVVRKPGAIKASSVNQELVSLLDLGPTVLNLAGVPVPAHMHGRPFLGPRRAPKRKYVYGFRDRMDERYDVVRSVFDGRYRYLRNFDFDKPYYQYMNTAEQGPTMIELRNAHNRGELPEPAERYFHPKPPEELYDVSQDPHELTNLAADPRHATRLARMRAECYAWMRSIGDLGLLNEIELNAQGKRYGSRYQILRQPSNAQLLDQLLDAAEAARRQDAAALTGMLSHPHSAVRQRAAAALSTLDTLPAQAQEPLRLLRKDPAAAVRIAAARTLARFLRNEPENIEILRAALSSADEWERLAAAIALDELGPQAKPAVAELQHAVDKDPNRYVGRVANHAVNQILGTNRKITGGFTLVPQ